MDNLLYCQYDILMEKHIIKVKALLNNKEIYKVNKPNYKNKFQNKNRHFKKKRRKLNNNKRNNNSKKK
jgi:hypothetical protein